LRGEKVVCFGRNARLKVARGKKKKKTLLRKKKRRQFAKRGAVLEVGRVEKGALGKGGKKKAPLGAKSSRGRTPRCPVTQKGCPGGGGGGLVTERGRGTAEASTGEAVHPFQEGSIVWEKGNSSIQGNFYAYQVDYKERIGKREVTSHVGIQPRR